MVGFFIALLSGALMSIQGVFNTEVTKTTGVGWQCMGAAYGICRLSDCLADCR